MTTVKKCPHCELLIGAALVQEPVVVIPAADWERLVELWECGLITSHNLSRMILQHHAEEIDAIIKKVQP